jgi:ADP-heptose:LPS heptosyltransferase
MYGLGDCIYVRPVLKYLWPRNITLITPWPQVFHDIPGLSFILSSRTGLHSQQDNIAKYKDKYKKERRAPDYSLCYDLKRHSGLESFFSIMTNCYPQTVDKFMECKPEWLETAKQFLVANKLTSKPICLIRPNTQRPEWYSWARSPKHEYLQLFIDMFQGEFHFISIANIKPNVEFYEHKLHRCDCYIEQPSFDLTFGLFKIADLIVCSPSFWAALAPAFDKPSLCLFGAGELPHRVIDPRLQNKTMTILAPKPFDDCVVNRKGRFKDIPLSILMDAYTEKVGSLPCYA